MTSVNKYIYNRDKLQNNIQMQIYNNIILNSIHLVYNQCIR